MDCASEHCIKACVSPRREPVGMNESLQCQSAHYIWCKVSHLHSGVGRTAPKRQFGQSRFSGVGYKRVVCIVSPRLFILYQSAVYILLQAIEIDRPVRNVESRIHLSTSALLPGHASATYALEKDTPNPCQAFVACMSD